jgi:uncharacterized protein (TIGR03084 family)
VPVDAKIYLSAVKDLSSEHDQLRKVLSVLKDEVWDKATPADSWMIRDCVSHLAYFDEAANLAMTDKDSFAKRVELLKNTSGDPMIHHLKAGREMNIAALYDWFLDANREMLKSMKLLSGSERVPWFGPDMSSLSMVTARLMETWAHSKDIYDALSIELKPTLRLIHVAELGVRTLEWSFFINNLEPPDDIYVSLDLNGKFVKSWGNKNSVNKVTGELEDFCLVVVQRRHYFETGLIVEGDGAIKWMEIAQAFAGDPGKKRPPKSQN